MTTVRILIRRENAKLPEKYYFEIINLSLIIESKFNHIN